MAGRTSTHPVSQRPALGEDTLTEGTCLLALIAFKLLLLSILQVMETLLFSTFVSWKAFFPLVRDRSDASYTFITGTSSAVCSHVTLSSQNRQVFSSCHKMILCQHLVQQSLWPTSGNQIQMGPLWYHCSRITRESYEQKDTEYLSRDEHMTVPPRWQLPP